MSDIAEYLTISENAVFDRLGEAATYTPLIGSPVAITVLPAQPDLLQAIGETRISSETTIFEVRTAELTPVVGASITYDSVVYKIKDVKRQDARRRTWIVETRPS